ncbi:TonB-dependent receptor plug domain-containing protein [Phenylobacterium sp.]|jgi:iron complex outermembrane receptor protein|uniref:TonB-dependent receptor plug domain-containing protein n=1 Tax=Phenylobacterium sp. TaxID=1871053 RepID=UPI003784BB63
MAVALGAAASPSLADEAMALAEDQQAQAELGQLSLEELSKIEVRSVSRRPEALDDAGAAVFVITNTDIRRSGAMTLAEALRIAPNLEVMRIDALDYSVSARGFAGFEAANKLLVQIDGRTVYSPLFSGVDWDQQHLLLDDVAQIEVVSGPGGALWGANAVNGVVNVTSRSAHETQGWLAAGHVGTLDRDARVRYGGRLGEATAYRVYLTGYKRGDLRLANGRNANDGWDGVQGGARLDWQGARDTLTLQGDIHDNRIDNSLGAGAGYVRGGNILGRWTRTLGETGALEVQAYYDRVEREARLIYDSLDAYDVQVQHNFNWRRHAFVWGGGLRRTEDTFRTLFEPNLLNPASRGVTIASFFVQDQIALRDDLSLTLGMKLEDNSYTELDYMPSARLTWRLSEQHMVWGAVSRAIRNPSRIERDFFIAGLVAPGFMGSEELIAYEAGYRGRPTARTSLSLNVFYNDYDDLRTNELNPAISPPIYVGNTMRGRVWGLEAWGAFDVTPWWRLSAGANFIGKDFELKPGSRDVAQFEAMGADPDYWAKLRSQMQLGERVELDVGLRAYGDVPRLRASGYVGTQSYVEADVRVAWRITDTLELSVAGLNLLHDQHPEASETRRTEIPRSAYVGLRWAY